MSERFESDVMDDLFYDEAEGPARTAFEESVEEGDEWDGAEEGDEFLSRIVGGVGQALGGLLGAEDEFEEEGTEEFEGEESEEYEAESLEEAVADALEEEDSDEFLRRIRRIARGALNVARRVGRGVGSVARVVGPIASMIPLPQAQLIGRIANVAGRLLADGADEFEAIDELVEAYDEEAIDAAAPVIAGLTIRRAMPQAARLSRPVRRALVRNVTQATRTLVRRQGAPAARAAARIVQSTQRAVRRRVIPPRAMPRAVRRAAQRVARSPRAVRRLARPLARPGARLASPGARACPNCGARRLRLRGPVTISIRGR